MGDERNVGPEAKTVGTIVQVGVVTGEEGESEEGGVDVGLGVEDPMLFV